jgi:hypothetical protein
MAKSETLSETRQKFEAVQCFIAEAVKAIDAYDNADSWRTSAEWLAFIRRLITKCAEESFERGRLQGLEEAGKLADNHFAINRQFACKQLAAAIREKAND